MMMDFSVISASPFKRIINQGSSTLTSMANSLSRNCNSRLISEKHACANRVWRCKCVENLTQGFNCNNPSGLICHFSWPKERVLLLINSWFSCALPRQKLPLILSTCQLGSIFCAIYIAQLAGMVLRLNANHRRKKEMIKWIFFTPGIPAKFTVFPP